MRYRHQQGLALITAMLVVAIAATAAAYLSLDQQIWLRQAQNQSDREQAEAVRQAAEAWAITILDKDAKNNPGDDDLNQDWAKPLPALPVEGGQLAGQITDAQAKFNLNNLVPSNNPQFKSSSGIFQHILQTLSYDPNLIDAVIDWIDGDSEARPYGAEDIDYLQLKTPYRAANQPFTSVDELRLVRGFTPEMVDRLRPYITVLPKTSPINVNTADKNVLAVVFNLPASAIEQIVAQRPYKNAQEFAAKIQPLLAGGAVLPDATTYGVQSSYFEVQIDTQFGRYRRTTVSLIQRGAGGTPAGGTPAGGTPAGGTPAGGTPAGGTPAGGSHVQGHRQVLPRLPKTTENPDTSASGNI